MAFNYYISWSNLGLYYHGARWKDGAEPESLMTTYFTSSKVVQKLINEIGEPDIIQWSKGLPQVVRLKEQQLIKKDKKDPNCLNYKIITDQGIMDRTLYKRNERIGILIGWYSFKINQCRFKLKKKNRNKHLDEDIFMIKKRIKKYEASRQELINQLPADFNYLFYECLVRVKFDKVYIKR